MPGSYVCRMARTWALNWGLYSLRDSCSQEVSVTRTCTAGGGGEGRGKGG